jgi:hypothetical protein
MAVGHRIAEAAGPLKSARGVKTRLPPESATVPPVPLATPDHRQRVAIDIGELGEQRRRGDRERRVLVRVQRRGRAVGASRSPPRRWTVTRPVALAPFASVTVYSKLAMPLKSGAAA